jgi:hypothetical protein
MNRACITLAVVLLLFPTGQARGQTPDAFVFFEQAGALQSRLNKWQKVLSRMNLGYLPHG